MKYILNGTYVNDETVDAVPAGATELSAAEWDARRTGTRPLPEVKAAKLAQLEQARDAAERANVTVGGKVYSASEAFQAKVSRAINQAGRGKPIAGAADAWRTVDAQPVVMTAALLGQIEDAITAQGVAAWKKYWTLFDAVMAPGATVDDINKVTW